ncbi:hypothetical protein LguiA_025020 [Lonicera macranthoides]
MAWELKMRFVLLIMMFVDCILGRVVKELQVPCFFIFGDSLVDSGNNNKLVTLAKSNFLPYGIDTHTGPTGRFTNGRTTADVTAELLGFNKYIPPFATASGEDILLGVNYASAGSGIRKESGRILGDRISLDRQLKNHQTTIANIVKILGNNETATKHLNKCLYYVGMGSNDYINNYFMPQFYPTSHEYTPEEYATVLIQQYSQQIKTLYNYGARKVAISGLGPIGCSPYEIALRATNGACVYEINQAVELYNKNLISLVDELNNNLNDAKFIYLNIYDRSKKLIEDPSSFGFKVSNQACCGLDIKHAPVLCIPTLIPCANRNEFVFWDGFHVTDKANLMSATRSYRAQTPTDTYPFDIQHLIQL